LRRPPIPTRATGSTHTRATVATVAAAIALCVSAACSEQLVTAPAVVDSVAAPNLTTDTSTATVTTDVDAAAGGSLGNGQNQSTSIILAGQVDSWTFSGTQGEAATITMAKLSGTADFAPWIRLVAPNGTLLASVSNASVARMDLSLPQNGTYTVQAASFDPGNDGTGAYRIRMAKAPGAFVVPAGDHGGPLTNGANHTGVIAAGDLDIWSFTGNVGEAVTLTMAEVTGVADFAPWIRLIAPNGVVLANISNASTSRADLNLTQTGTYTVVVSSFDPGNDATGDYRLLLAQAPGSFTIPDGDEGGTATNGQNHTGAIVSGDLDMWSFTATNGEAITLTMAELTGIADFAPWIRLIAPNGVVLANVSGATVARTDLHATLTGVYTVVVSSFDPGNDATGDYRLILAKAPGTFTIPDSDDGGPTNNGVNKTGTIAVGDLDLWSFNATVGNAISITMAEVAGTAQFAPWIRVIAPNGAVLVNTSNPVVARDDFAAPQNGTYTVVVSSFDPGNDDTGDYRLIVAKAPGTFTTSPGDHGGALGNGVNRAGAIAVGDLDMYRFQGNVGDAITVTMAEVNGVADFSPWIRLIAPNGAVLANTSNPSVARLDVAATVTGTYTLVVSSFDTNNDATGNYRLILAKSPGAFTIPAGDHGGALTNGVSRNGVIAKGDLDMWSFNAVQGTTFTVTMTETSGLADFAPWVRVIAPNGTVLANFSHPSSVVLNLTATLTGAYTIVASSFDSGNDATGQYAVRVSGVGITSGSAAAVAAGGPEN
jgi:trimeric autotransporter adhesin